MDPGRADHTTQPHVIDPAIGLLGCPVCTQPLRRAGRSLLCGSGHSFDLARQGHVNLLRAAAPSNADTTAMVGARERFLASGAYQPLRSAVAAACEGATSVTEVGAGTGYYLAEVVARHQPARHLALDISVAAARRSARHGLASAVADTWAGLPVLDASLDRVLCVFAPRNPAEFARTLRPGGRVVVATPTSEHLADLRAQLNLLDVPTDKQDRLDEAMAGAGLHLSARSWCAFTVALDPQTAADLIAMGPNAFHRGPPVFTSAITVQVSTTISSYHVV